MLRRVYTGIGEYIYLYNVHIPVYIHYTAVHVDCGGKYSMIKCTIWYIEESEVDVSAPA